LIVVSLWRFLEQPGKLSNRDYLSFFAVSGLFWIYASSLLWSVDLASGITFLKSQLFLIAVPFIILLNRSLISTHSKRFTGVLIAAICLSWLATFVMHFLPEDLVRQMTSNKNLFLPYADGNRELFGMYSPFITRIQQSNFLGIGVIFSLFSFGRYQKPIYIITGFWCLAGLVFLGGRGGQVGFFIAIAVFSTLISIHFGKSVFQKLALGVGALLLLGLAGYMMVFHMEPVKSRYAQHRYEMEMFRSGEYRQADYYHFTSLRRFVSWENSKQLIRQQPIIGTGIGDYQAAYKQQYDLGAIDLPLNNHSQYLQVAGAAGIAGLALWLICLSLWFGLVFSKNTHYLYRISAISCMVLYIVAMIPDALLLKQVDSVHFSFLLSWWIGTDQ
jgi:O-antigen ligase